MPPKRNPTGWPSCEKTSILDLPRSKVLARRSEESSSQTSGALMNFADHRQFTTIPDIPPPGWQYETPVYRVDRNIHPAPRARYRYETPFAEMSDNDCWQYGDRAYQAGEIISTTEWPMASWRPLNYAAKKILDFYNLEMKSRLPRSPFYGDRLRLDTGLSGTAITAADATTPTVPRVRLSPAS